MALIDDFIDDPVAANTTNTRLSPIVPAGTEVTIKKFGCFVRASTEKAIVAIQWGSGGSFQTIRAISGVFELNINRVFIGDGVKRFRIVRINKTALETFEIAAWFEAMTRDGSP